MTCPFCDSAAVERVGQHIEAVSDQTHRPGNEAGRQLEHEKRTVNQQHRPQQAPLLRRFRYGLVGRFGLEQPRPQAELS